MSFLSKQLMAFIHAIWRCRCVITQGHPFSDFEDLVVHVRSIIEDPWLHGSPNILARRERRALRATAPDIPYGTHVYFFDGASRSSEHGRLASYGALLRHNNTVIARVAVFLGDMSNNEAEYQGALAVLQHACTMRYSHVPIYRDSKLIVKHLSGEWRCKALNLTPLYEHGLAFIRLQGQAFDDNSLLMSHVFREFNVNADSLANIALDQRTPATDVVVDLNWFVARNTLIA